MNGGSRAGRPQSLLVQGRLVIDPAKSAEPGWVRCDPATGCITEVGFGELPRGSALPDLGGPGRLLCPAFIDAHFHIPQVDCIGCDGMPLLDWLDRIVFPAEVWWGKGRALHDARTAARRLAEQGTVGVAAYLSSHGEASAEVLGYLARTPMRWMAGRVAMDRAAPAELTAEDHHRPKMRPVPSPIAAVPIPAGRTRVTANPRFAISCSEELLAEVGWAVRDYVDRTSEQIFIQTHLAESLTECERVAELFPRDASYAHLYDRFGLLTPRTLLAHCIHLRDDEWRIISQRGSVIVHCPTANLFLQSGMFDLGAARRFGVRIALGSDVAGGPDLAMPRVARAMIETAKARKILIGTASEAGDALPVPTVAEAWSMITRGNADALGWSDGGRIEMGAAADLLVLNVPETWHDEHLIGRLIYNWSPDLIEARVFGGSLVDPARLA